MKSVYSQYRDFCAALKRSSRPFGGTDSETILQAFRMTGCFVRRAIELHTWLLMVRGQSLLFRVNGPPLVNSSKKLYAKLKHRHRKHSCDRRAECTYFPRLQAPVYDEYLGTTKGASRQPRYLSLGEYTVKNAHVQSSQCQLKAYVVNITHCLEC